MGSYLLKKCLLSDLTEASRHLSLLFKKLTKKTIDFLKKPKVDESLNIGQETWLEMKKFEFLFTFWV